MDEPTPTTRLGWTAQAAILVALVVNLWFGGDLLEQWLGATAFAHVVRALLELTMISAWLILVVGMRAPWKRPPSSDERDRPTK